MRNCSAFTLVELSIVLVILGLLVGGVLSGQSLIRAAELRKVTVTRTQWNTSVLTFRDKYLGLPGDFQQARSFWPSCTDGSGMSNGVPSNPCGGNGDGIIDDAVPREEIRVAQHLALAGLVEGTFNGNINENGADFTVVWLEDRLLRYVRILHYGERKENISDLWEDLRTGHAFEYSDIPSGKISTEEIFLMDKKLDDGNGLTGIFRIRRNDWGGSTDYCMHPTTGEYQLDKTSDFCSIVVFASF